MPLPKLIQDRYLEFSLDNRPYRIQTDHLNFILQEPFYTRHRERRWRAIGFDSQLHHLLVYLLHREQRLNTSEEMQSIWDAVEHMRSIEDGLKNAVIGALERAEWQKLPQDEKSISDTLETA